MFSSSFIFQNFLCFHIFLIRPLYVSSYYTILFLVFFCSILFQTALNFYFLRLQLSLSRVQGFILNSYASTTNKNLNFLKPLEGFCFTFSQCIFLKNLNVDTNPIFVYWIIQRKYETSSQILCNQFEHDFLNIFYINYKNQLFTFENILTIFKIFFQSYKNYI